MLKQQIVLKDKLLNLIHLNIRSVKKNFDQLILLLETYELDYCDIIILSECFQLNSCNQYNIPGYSTHYNMGDFNKNDGILILIKSDLDVIVSHNKLISSQATVTRITFNQCGVTFGISAVYKPPPINELLFVEDLRGFFEQNLSKNIEIFTGDININIENNDNHSVNEYLSLMGQHGFMSYINSPTRVTTETSSCIDHLFVNKKININKLNLKSFILGTDITDHYPIMLNINSEKNVNNSHNHLDNSYEFIDYASFKDKISSQDWSEVLNSNDPEQATNTFMTIFQQILNKYKSRKFMKSRQKKKIKEWITTGLIISIKHRDKLKKKLLRNYTRELEKEYKLYRNQLNTLIKKQKYNYYKSQIENNMNDVKKIYRIISDATNEKNKYKNTNINFVDEKNSEFLNNTDMANFCNNYFIDIGTEMEKKIDVPQNPFIFDYHSTDSMYLKPVTENEIINQISSLKNHSAPGLDGVSAKLIKLTHIEIAQPMAHIINLIFKTGLVPSYFKQSVVTPIFKDGPKNKVQNYRPISLINNFAKLLEKCLKERLTNFFKSNNILSNNQFGFTENVSTADAMYTITSEITNSLNDSKKCIAVFIDLAKAFDTVPHQKLLDVLSHYGVRGSVLEVFKSYLNDRVQYLKINNTLSDPQKIKIGVPQGTILGPILFITYINSLLNIKINGKIISYADDTALIFTGSTWEETKDSVIQGCEIVKNWLDTFKLSLNIKKTNYIAFSLKNVNRPNFNSITIDNKSSSTIKAVENTKYLGIIIDQHLKWSDHINYLTKKIRKLIHKFYMLKEFLNVRVITLVYKALIESLLRYGIIVWGGTYKCKLQPLAVIQNSILKIMFNKNWLFPTNLLYNDEICNINTLYIQSVCSYIHKTEKLKNIVSHQHQTRGKINRHVIIPISRKTINLKFIDYLAPKFYNLLPNEIKQIKSKKNFNKKSKMFIIKNYEKFNKLMI